MRRGKAAVTTGESSFDLKGKGAYKGLYDSIWIAGKTAREKFYANNSGAIQ